MSTESPRIPDPAATMTPTGPTSDEVSPDGTDPDASVLVGMDPRLRPLALLAWLWVAVPFSYGIYKLTEKIPDLF